MGHCTHIPTVGLVMLVGGILACSVLSARAASPKVPTSNTHRYVALYKPALTLCSLRSDKARSTRKHRPQRQTLADLEDLPENLHICGRLDRDSEGLLLLTDDGSFTDRVCSPAGSCRKVYWALVTRGTPTDEALDTMRRHGLLIRVAVTLPPVSVRLVSSVSSPLLPRSSMDTGGACSIDIVDMLPPAVPGMDRAGTWLEIVLTEGRHRQVRRITAHAGHPTLRLVRVAIGSLELQHLDLLQQPNQWRFVEKDWVQKGA